jgi:hypothetical protein
MYIKRIMKHLEDIFMGIDMKFSVLLSRILEDYM